MRVGFVRLCRAAKLVAFVTAAAASAAFMLGTSARATETLALKTAISLPNKITSFDISFVNTTLGFYLLGDRTGNAVDVISTSTNTLIMQAGQGLFSGATASNNNAGPDGVMTVLNREIWAGDGPSTLRFLSLANGSQLGSVNTGGQFRVDEMCFDSVHNIGFVANNADNPPFITAVNWRTHSIIGKIVFDGTLGTPLATDGIEQCQFDPRDGKIYVSVPEINGPGNNTAAGGVSRIDPVALQVVSTTVIPITVCSGPQGMAIGPLVGNFGEILEGCNGSPAPSFAALPRSTALIDDGSVSGVFGNAIALPFQAGNDMVTFNSADNHYYLARSGTNSFNNLTPDPVTNTVFGCPNVAGAINYGGAIFVGANSINEAFGGPTFAGPQVLGMINALTLENDPDTITGLFSCPAGSPGPNGVGTTTVSNTHGGNHSVAADPAHNQIYVPIASTAFAAGMTGICARGGGVDANGCIAVFTPSGSDP